MAEQLGVLSDEDSLFFSRLPEQYRDRALGILARMEERYNAEVARRDEEKPCGFPEHRHYKYGHVTHMRPLMSADGYEVLACVVCGTVQANPIVALAGLDGG